MTKRKVINGSVQLDPVVPPALQTVKLLVDKIVDGSVRAKEEIVSIPELLAAQWIAAQEAEAIAVETPALTEPVAEELPALRKKGKS